MIKKDCPRCGGDGGWYVSGHQWVECPRCGGSGKRSVSAGEMAEKIIDQLAKSSIMWSISQPAE